MTTATTQLGELRTRRDGLLAQADTMQEQISALAPTVSAYHRDQMSGQHPKEPKQLKEYEAAIHQRARVVKQASELANQINTAEAARRQVENRIEQLNKELAPWTAALVAVPVAQAALSEIDSALSAAGGSQVTINTLRAARSALERSGAILEELARLRARKAEIGE